MLLSRPWILNLSSVGAVLQTLHADQHAQPRWQMVSHIQLSVHVLGLHWRHCLSGLIIDTMCRRHVRAQGCRVTSRHQIETMSYVVARMPESLICCLRCAAVAAFGVLGVAKPMSMLRCFRIRFQADFGSITALTELHLRILQSLAGQHRCQLPNRNTSLMHAYVA